MARTRLEQMLKEDLKNSGEFEEISVEVFFDKNKTKKDEDDDGSTDDDDSPNYRNKYKELKEAFKNQLPIKSREAIDEEDEAMDEIIEQLKTRGMTKDRGIEMQRIRNIERKGRLINRN